MRTIINKDKRNAADIFNSITEFTAYLNKAKTNKTFARRDLASNDTREYYTSNAGTQSFGEAQRLMRNGYKEGVKKLLSAAGAIKVKTPAHVQHTRLHVAGQAACVPAALQGQPKTMYCAKKEMKTASVIKLFYNNTATWETSTDTIERAGANIVELAKYIEKKGVRVNLYVITAVKGGKSGHVSCVVRIKDSAAPLNIQAVSYPIIHASFLRRHLFRWIECSKITVGMSANYGKVVQFGVQGRLIELGVMDNNSYYCDLDTAAAAKTIEDLLLSIGLKL